jgi:hypothetical protein
MIVYECGPHERSRYLRREGTVTSIGFSGIEKEPMIHITLQRADGKGSFGVHLTSAEIDRILRYREEHREYFWSEDDADAENQRGAAR